MEKGNSNFKPVVDLERDGICLAILTQGIQQVAPHEWIILWNVFFFFFFFLSETVKAEKNGCSVVLWHPLRGCNDTAYLSAWPVVTWLSKRSQTWNTSICFVETKFIGCQNPSDSQLKIDWKKEACASKGETVCTGERQKTFFFYSSAVCMLDYSVTAAFIVSLCVSSPYSTLYIYILYIYISP